MRSAACAPVLLVLAGTSCQPVDTADVAQRLAEIVRTGPVNGLAADLDGPQVLDASRHTAGDVLAVIGARRPVRPVWIPGRSVPGSRLVIISPRHARGARTWRSYPWDHCRAEPGVLLLPYTDAGCRSGAAEDRAEAGTRTVVTL